MLDERIIAEIEAAGFDFTEKAIIKKVGSEWCVFNSDGTKNLGCEKTRPAAEKRLAQVEMFKHMKSGKEMAKTFCYDSNCGAEFMCSNNCDDCECPVCGATDGIYELTGILD